MGPEPITEVLDRAVGAGLISRDVADSIVEHERARSAETATDGPAPSRIPAAAEAVGYLGAAVLILGVISLIGSAWPDLGVGERIAILAAAVALLFGVGVPLDEQVPIEWRLRAVVWGLSIGAMAGLAAELVVDAWNWAGEPSAVGIGGAVGGYAAALWRRGPRPTAQAGTLVGVLVLVGGSLAWLDGPGAVGVGIAVLGAAWFAAATRGLVPPEWSAVPLGVAAVLVGPGVAAGEWATAAPIAGVVVAGVLVSIGAMATMLVVTVAGVIGVVIYLPWTLSELFGESSGPGVMQVVTGVVLLGAMLVLLRFRRGAGEAR